MNSSNSVELSLGELAKVLKRDARWILLGGLLGGVVLYSCSFLIPPTFKANATLIPMNPRDALGSLSALGVDIQSLGIGNTSGEISPAMYPEMAKSRSVLQAILMDTLEVPSARRRIPFIDWLGVRGATSLRLENGLKALRDQVSVTIDRRTGTLTISAKDRDPTVAAYLANSVANRLQSLVVSMLASHAGERRKFIENRRDEVRGDLSAAEAALQRFREQNLRIGNSPRLQLEESRYVRAVREQEEVYLTLSREHELAKIEEHRDVPLLASLDAAQAPAQRFWPRRLLLALFGALLGCTLVLAKSLFSEPHRLRA